MNLLAFVWLVGCIAVAVLAFAIPNDVWAAIAERIRTHARRAPPCSRSFTATGKRRTSSPTQPARRTRHEGHYAH